MSPRILFVTGTDTGVGKSVLAVALTRHLRRSGVLVAAVKPFCSGGRGDALALRQALGDTLSLNEINPWHFRPALAPGVAAEAQPHRPSWRDAVRHILSTATRHEITVVEGAGGLLSPLTTDGDATDLIRRLKAIPLVVCPNRLGAINQALLAFHALPTAAAKQARLVLMRSARPDRSTGSNLVFLRSSLGSDRVLELPWLGLDERQGRAPFGHRARRVLEGIIGLIAARPPSSPS